MDYNPVNKNPQVYILIINRWINKSINKGERKSLLQKNTNHCRGKNHQCANIILKIYLGKNHQCVLNPGCGSLMSNKIITQPQSISQ